MERRFFIKNIFGAIVGVALLPTAITETVTKPVQITSDGISIYADIRRFCVGDIIRLQDGSQYLITVIDSIGEPFAKARSLTLPDTRLTLKQSLVGSHVKNAHIYARAIS